MKREFVQLAHTLKTDNLKQHIGGWWYSDKLDGERCFWDGGVSRNIRKADVPWANNLKDERYKTPPVCSGLWSRYGNVIHAPYWFVESLPAIPLDGELFALNNQKRQLTHSAIKKIVPMDSEWKDITYMVFDSPPPDTIFADGIIDTTNYKKTLRNCASWWFEKRSGASWYAKPDTPFQTTYTMLKGFLASCNPDIVRLHNQFVLPFSQDLALKVLESRLATVVEWGGEGLMVRDPNQPYTCARVHHMLKMKPFDDMEGTVIGYISGRETELGSKLLGLMGALVLKLDNGIILKLSGFTEPERTLVNNQHGGDVDTGFDWAKDHPETEVPSWIEAPAFPRGTRVTFKYRGLSTDGVPLDARYWRNR